MTESRVLELQAGEGEPASMVLRSGEQMLPMGIGSTGAWRVRAAGVLDIHAYIYFDGSALFVQSADERHPVLVDGQAIGRAWTPVNAPCTIALAAAELRFREATSPFNSTLRDEDSTLSRKTPPEEEDDDPTVAGRIPTDDDATVAGLVPSEEDRTVAAPIPAPRASGPSVVVSPGPQQRPFAPGAFVNPQDRESTRFQPIADPHRDDDVSGVGPLGETPALGAPAAMTRETRRAAPIRPAAGVRWDTQPPPDGPTNDLQEELSTVPKDLLGRQLSPEDLVSTTPLATPPSPGRQPPVTRAPMAPPVQLLNVPPPAPPPTIRAPTLVERATKEWKETPPLKKVLFFLMPLMLPVVWFTFGDEPPPPRPRAGAAASTSGALASGAPGVTSAPSGFPPGYPPLATTPTAPASAPTALAVGTTGATPAVQGPRIRPQPVAEAKAAGAAAPEGSAAPVDRREHQAADFVATGQYDQAAALYEQLAAERPENPAFHEAARILRTKLDNGTR